MTINGVIESDYNALVALYNSTNGANWTDNTNWLTNADVSTWYGVTVSGDRVTGISLNSTNLALHHCGMIYNKGENFNSPIAMNKHENQLS